VQYKPNLLKDAYKVYNKYAIQIPPLATIVEENENQSMVLAIKTTQLNGLVAALRNKCIHHGAHWPTFENTEDQIAHCG